MTFLLLLPDLTTIHRVAFTLPMRIRIPCPLFILESFLLRLAFPRHRPIVFRIKRELF